MHHFWAFASWDFVHLDAVGGSICIFWNYELTDSNVWFFLAHDLDPMELVFRVLLLSLLLLL